MENSFETIDTKHGLYEKVNEALHEELLRIDYVALATEYNLAGTGTIFLIQSDRSGKVANLYRALKRRGLEPKIDFVLTKVLRDASNKQIPPEKRPLALKKLTRKLMKDS